MKGGYPSLRGGTFIKGLRVNCLFLCSADPWTGTDLGPETGPDRTGLEHLGPDRFQKTDPYHHVIISSYHHTIISSYHHIIMSPCHNIITSTSSYHHIIIPSFSKKNCKSVLAQKTRKKGNQPFYPSAKSCRELKLSSSGVNFRGRSARNAQKFIAPPKRAILIPS